MKQLRIEYIPLDKLQRAHRNPKDHDIGELSKSIERFDFVAPLIMDEASGRLVVGHGRLDTLQQMKATGKAPPGRIIKKGDSWLVPVVYGIEFKSDDEAMAYLLADNRLTELGGWNQDQLTQILSDLAAHGEEALNGVGWDSDDVDKMLGEIGNNANQQDLEIQEQFQIIVECETEQEQVKLLTRFEEEGIKCRALIS